MIFPKISTLPCYKQKGNGERFTLYTAVAVFKWIYSHLKNKNGYRFYLLPEVCRQVSAAFFLTENAVIGLYRI